MGVKPPDMEVTRTFDILNHALESYEKEVALAGKVNKHWVTYSSREYLEKATLFSYGLLALGMQPGDKVAMISNNRPEWNFADMGMSQAGIIHVPVYPTLSNEEYEYIFNHAEPRLIIVSDQALYKKIRPLMEKAPSLKDIYTFNEVEGARNWKELIELGRKNEEKFKDKLKKIRDSIRENDMVTLIYTSGTTGLPKGVALSHRNLVSNVMGTIKVHPFGPESKSLSFLPLCHIYERMLNYHYQYKGISIYYAENLGTIVDDLRNIKPDIFTTVPRLLETVYNKIIGKGKDLPGIKKRIFFWAVNLGLRYKLHNQNSWFYRLQLKIADKLIFSKWREALGGNIKIIVSGSAALQPRIATIFWAAGIKVLEGYGLTETSPVIAVNNYNTNEIMIGTVGPVIEEANVKIAEDGEILCKGPNVMLGYYKDEKMTEEAIDSEGWFHTGDVGQLIDGKYLKITDRKKEIFKLSSGKYVAPQVIENKFKESFFIEQIMVVGENEKFASALIVPNFEFLHNWCYLHKIKFRNNKELIEIPEVVARYQKEVNEINQKLAFHEQIKRFRLVHEEWSIATGELSNVLKLKRKNIYQKYEPLLREIYSYTNGEKNRAEKNH